MARNNNLRVALCLGGAIGMFCACGRLRAEDSAETRQQLRQVQQQNEALQNQLRQQQTLIESLTRKVGEIQEADASRHRQLGKLEAEMKEASPPAKSSLSSTFGKLSIT